MSESREQAVRERAYALWEQDGRPDGRSVAHWSQAEMEIAVEQALAAQALAAQDKVKAVKTRRRKSPAKSLH